MNISIFGLGYVGCVSLGCLAKNGFQVIGVDVNKIKVDLINQGLPTIIEKDIDIIIKEQWKAGNIYATQDYYQAVMKSDISIICVGTPLGEDGNLNLEYIYQTAEQIGEALKNKDSFHIVVIRSTVVPGTNQKVSEIIYEESGKKINIDFAVVSNPEFLREGTAVKDYYNPPFTLIGTDNDKAADIMKQIYDKVNGEFIRTNIKIAEMIKYVNNSFHALKVTFANEMGTICKNLDIDSLELMNIFCMDKQLNISPYYLCPGFAYGGSCLPKDLNALKTMAMDLNIKTPVLNSIELSNQNHIQNAIQLIKKSGKTKIGILGISFKEGTDDLRYSPIINVIEELLAKGFQVKIYDNYVQTALLIGSNKEYLEKNLPYLKNLMVKNEKDLIIWSEMIVINRKKEYYRDLIFQYPEKSFLDLVHINVKIKSSNYQGICW